MEKHNSSSFGIYELCRILIPGFYFTSILYLFVSLFIKPYIPLELTNSQTIIIFTIFILISGLTMYSKESTKLRKAFYENQPSAFLQELSRKLNNTYPLNESEARQLYFYLLNNYMSITFHEKIIFFGTIYHILIQIRRTSFWFALIATIFLIFQIPTIFSNTQGINIILFCVILWIIYFLSVNYNKADRKMQENYQDQIFWLVMNKELVKELLEKYTNVNKGNQNA